MNDEKLSDNLETPLVALTIAGFDPSGGAGVLADVKTFNAHGFFATAAVTSLTYQNTIGVYGAANQSGEAVFNQIKPVVDDFAISCVKTGMLPSKDVIEQVARAFVELKDLPAPVVDPVVRSTSGYDLIDDAALQSLIETLFPLARVVTPNIAEAERIARMKIENEDDMIKAAHNICDLGARAVLVKGGDLRKEKVENRKEKVKIQAQAGVSVEAVDVLVDEAGEVTMFHAPFIETTSTHGTGCTLAAAIACGLGQGKSLIDAVDEAKRFVTHAIKTAPRLGHGNSPLNIGMRDERQCDSLTS